ncbi:hypothetical protein [Aquidulcibacter paucihalophilus]|uniref:hypothetical protein n=1 Tax=Aquidulcibacter paucihalophilus TaxID=1978549 RepID=UPI000A18F7B4|nr:hypothetical protein [Aquidulcibacter paucihalophilus]
MTIELNQPAQARKVPPAQDHELEETASRAFDILRAIGGLSGNPDIVPDRHDRDALWRLVQLLEADLIALEAGRTQTTPN